MKAKKPIQTWMPRKRIRAERFVPGCEFAFPKERRKKIEREDIVSFQATASGTGFFISEDGFLVTNEHVVRDAAQVLLVTSAGSISARVVKVDAANDLALLKVDVVAEFATSVTEAHEFLETVIRSNQPKMQAEQRRWLFEKLGLPKAANS